MESHRFRTDLVWTPNENSGRRMKEFMKTIEDKYNEKFEDYFEFHLWSVTHIQELWAELWDFMGIICSQRFDEVVDLNIPMSESPKWFEGARLNFAENLLKYRDDHVAIIVAGENREVENVTFKELYEKAKLYTAAFRNSGLKKGDRVACYMSNRIEAVVAMISVTSIGAIWTGALPMCGPQAYLNRIKQVDPKFLIAVDQFPHNGEQKYILPNIREIAKGLKTLEKVIIVPANKNLNLQDISSIPNSCTLDEFLQGGRNSDGSVPDMVFEQVSFSHPVFISFTSGSTGLPKTIVHGFGALLGSTRDLWIHWNSSRDDIWLSICPAGWVSFNLITNVLFVGETIALFEGVPFFLSPTYLWDLIQEINISRFLFLPSIMDTMEIQGFVPTSNHHLTSLKLIIGTSSVVKLQNFDFVLQKIKKDVMFIVGHGCTELMGFTLVSEQTLKVYKGEISWASLGVDFEFVDDSGHPVVEGMGEYVIKSPLPTFPIGIWGDEDGSKFKSYFSKYEGKFAMGDTMILNPDTRGIICCGRSEETLNPRGYRYGSSEIYNIVALFPEIRDSLCVGQFNKNRDERAVLFIKMKEDDAFTEELKEKLRTKIANELSIQHVPEIMLQVPDIPYNMNGKKVEIIVKKIINKMPVNTEMVVNQKCLDFFHDIPELDGF